MAYKYDQYRNNVQTTYPHTRKEQEENYKREKVERDYDHKLYNDARSRINTLDDDD